MQVEYKGPFDAVTIAENGQTVERNKPSEIESDLAARLCEQSDWQRVAKTNPKKDDEQ
jgi:hypothetical protein